MGNNGSNEVTLEQSSENFIQTGDGIKLSSNLVGRLSSENPHLKSESSNNGEGHAQARKKVNEATRLAEEYQEILDEREKQMSKAIKKFENDLKNERAKHERFYDLSLEAFERYAKETEEKFKKPDLKPVCESLQTTLLDCYKNNPGRILDCSQSVRNFQNCVNQTKDALLAKPSSV